MAFVTPSINCCGLKELADIRDSSSVAHTILAVHTGKMAGFIIFTDTNRMDFEYGIELAREIDKHGLGWVTRSEVDAVNPNTGNELRAWIWAPDYDKIQKYISKEKQDGRLKQPDGVQQGVAKEAVGPSTAIGGVSDSFPRPPGNWARGLSYLGAALPLGRGFFADHGGLSDIGAIRPGGAGGGNAGLLGAETRRAPNPYPDPMGVRIEAEYWLKPDVSNDD